MRQALAAVICAAVSASACVRAQERPSATAALKDAVVTVWVVTPGNEAERNRATLRTLQKRLATGAVAPGYKESTAGSFGQPSSEVGQSAGSYGQSAGSFGKNASDTGQSAGSYGQSAGSLGTSASSAGQPAGTYGQSAGSFGQPASTYGQTLSGQSLGPVAKPAGSPAAVRNIDRERTADELDGAVRAALSPRKVNVFGIAEEDLEDRLAVVQGTDGYPDVVLLGNLPHSWNEAGIGLTMLGRPSYFDAGDKPRSSLLRRFLLWPVVMVKAPHPLQARALVVWMRDANYCAKCEVDEFEKEQGKAASVAIGAMRQMLSGGGLGGDADQDAAKFSGPLAQQLAFNSGSDVSGGGQPIRVDVMSTRLLGPLALVTLRGIIDVTGAFGVVHGRAVLRKDEQGRWKVLQLSPNLGAQRLDDGTRLLTTAAERRKDTPVAVLAPISAAAPGDGDNRSPRPDLWWDNAGDPSLMLVEWQRKAGSDAWTDPRLMFLPESSWRLQTRVTAAFAEGGGAYRWRVWSVGHGGTLLLSPWRTFNIVQ